MGRKSLGIEDYKKIAKEHHLEFVPDQAPMMTRISTTWKCIRCGRVIKKSYDNLRHGTGDPCICKRPDYVNGPDKYRELASRLGIEWASSSPPQNTKEVTLWYSPSKDENFEATYSDLAYSYIPKRYREFIDEKSLDFA